LPGKGHAQRSANRNDLRHGKSEQRLAAEQDERAHDATTNSQRGGRHQRWINDTNRVDIFTQRRHEARLN